MDLAAFNADIPPPVNLAQRRLIHEARNDFMTLWQFGPADSVIYPGKEIIWAFSRALTKEEWVSFNPADYFSGAEQGSVRIAVCARVGSEGTFLVRALVYVPPGIALPVHPARLAGWIEMSGLYVLLPDALGKVVGAPSALGANSLSGTFYHSWLPPQLTPSSAVQAAPERSGWFVRLWRRLMGARS